MYTTTSEIIARLGVLEKAVLECLSEIQLMKSDLIDNGVIIYQNGLEQDAQTEAVIEAVADELPEKE